MELVETSRSASSPFGGGMDWLEVKLPEHTVFRNEVKDVIEATVMNSSYPTSLHYGAVIDLRKSGTADAILHLSKKRGPEHSHKLQMVGAAQFGFGQHLAEVESVADVNPANLQPMRTDLTVDLRNVPVSYFVTHGRVQGKQFANAGGESSWQMGKGEIQTFYVGKRPNCIRVYNKTAERWEAYKAFTRGYFPPEPDFDKWSKKVLNKTGQEFIDFERHCFLRGEHPQVELDKMREAIGTCHGLFQDLHYLWEKKCIEIGPKPSFREFCGLDREEVITRFERQIGAQQIKGIHLAGDRKKIPIFSTMADLRANLKDFNPFGMVSFGQGSVPDFEELPAVGNYSITDYMAGMNYRDRILRETKQLADAWVRRNSNGHGKEILAKLEAFVPLRSKDQGEVISSGELYERYRSAITKQLAA